MLQFIMTNVLERLLEMDGSASSKIVEFEEMVEQTHFAWLNEVLETVQQNFGRYVYMLGLF